MSDFNSIFNQVRKPYRKKTKKLIKEKFSVIEFEYIIQVIVITDFNKKQLTDINQRTGPDECC